MVDLLVIGARLQRAPVELAEIAHVEPLLAVVEHVHALVRKLLVGHVLNPELDFEQLVLVPVGHAERLVACLVGTRADFAGSHVRRRGVQHEGLEAPAGLVVVGLCSTAAVAHVERFGGIAGAQIGAMGIAVAAVEGADLAVQDAGLAGRGKRWRRRVDQDRAADAVAPDADRRDTGIDLDRADVTRGDVGEHRVHVIRAGGRQIHAVEQDTVAIVGQSMDDRQAGKTAAGAQADPGNVAQQTCSVAGGRAACRQIGRPQRRSQQLAQVFVRGEDQHLGQLDDGLAIDLG